MVVTGPEQQRSKAELTADIRARRRTALVVNVRSCRGHRHYPTVCRQLHNAGLALLDLRPVADPRRLPQALAGAADSGADGRAALIASSPSRAWCLTACFPLGAWPIRRRSSWLPPPPSGRIGDPWASP